MANETENTEGKSFSDSSIGKFISNIGITLAHVKDALLKDLLDDMPNYFPQKDLDKTKKYQYDNFIEAIGEKEEEKKHLTKYIEALFTRLGYNISDYEKNDKLINLVKTIIALTISIGDAVPSFFDLLKMNYTDELKTLIKTNKDEKKEENKDFFDQDPDLEQLISFGGDTGSKILQGINFGDGKLAKLLKAVINLVTMIKQFVELDWDSMKKDDDGAFGAYVDDHNFKNKLAERIFYHIFIIMIRDAKEIFDADLDINFILEKLDKEDAEKKISKELTTKAEERFNEKNTNPKLKFEEEAFQKKIQELKDVRKEIVEIEKRMNGETEKFKNEANEKKPKKEVVRSVAIQSPILLKLAKAKLDKLIKEVLGDSNSVGKILSGVYAALDLLKIFDTETVQLAKYFKDPNSDALTPDLSEFDEDIKKAYGLDSATSQEDMKTALDNLKGKSVPVLKINVIRWDNLKKLATGNFKYAATLFKIRDTEEAEAALVKIMNFINSFKNDLPDFGSLRNLLYEMMIRIWNRLKENESETDDKKKLSDDDFMLLFNFENFVIDLLKIQERFSIGVKVKMTTAFKDFTEDRDSLQKLLTELKENNDSNIQEKFKSLVEKLKDTDAHHEKTFIEDLEKLFPTLKEKITENTSLNELDMSLTKTKKALLDIEDKKYLTDADALKNAIKKTDPIEKAFKTLNEDIADLINTLGLTKDKPKLEIIKPKLLFVKLKSLVEKSESCFDEIKKNKAIVLSKNTIEYRENLQTKLIPILKLCIAKEAPLDALKTSIMKDFTDDIIKYSLLNDDKIPVWFLTPFHSVIVEKASDHEWFDTILPDKWTNAIKADGDLFTNYINVMKDSMIPLFTIPFEDNRWEAKYDTIIKTLKEDFEWRTSHVPNDFEIGKSLWKFEIMKGKELEEKQDIFKKLAKKEDVKVKTETKNEKGNPENKEDDGSATIANGLPFLLVSEGTETAKYPFTDFDFIRYFTLFTEKLKDIISIPNIDLFYIKFREITVAYLVQLIKGTADLNKKVSGNDKEKERRLRAFAEEVFVCYWSEMKPTIYKAVIAPYEKKLGKLVKSWLKDCFMPSVLSGIISDLGDYIKVANYNTIFENRDFTGNLKIIGNDESLTINNPWGSSAQKMAEGFLGTNMKGDDIDYGLDGLQYALKLYKLLPKDIQKQMPDLVGLGEKNYGGVKLPDYKLDFKNKMIAVTVFEKKGKGTDQGGTANANISINVVALVGERTVGEEGKEVKEAGIFLLPTIQGSYDSIIDVSENHQLTIKLIAGVNTNIPDNNNLGEDFIGFFFTTKESDNTLSTDLNVNKEALSALIHFIFARKDKNQLTFFDTEFAKLMIDNYPQQLFLGYVGDGGNTELANKSGFEVGYLGKLEKLVLTLRLHKINEFLKNVFKDDIIIDVKEFSVGWSLIQGLKIDGEFRIRIPINANIDLTVVKFSNMVIEIGSSFTKKDTIAAKFLTNFAVNFSGIVISFIEFGLALDINYMKEDGTFGDLNIAPQLQFPSGLSISIDVTPVKGTGIIIYNKEKEEFLGALELNIANVGGISALILFNMRMPDGSKGFSFMGAISMRFTPGIQLSMGFTLTGVGGALGINRRMDIDKLRAAVRTGALGSILFIENLEKNLDFVIANVTQYYPVQDKQYFFGILAQISYDPILTANLGLFIQFPNPVVIVIAGSIKISINEDAESLIIINVEFLGGIDFTCGLFFDASLVNSKLVGIDLVGDMALRLYWTGPVKGFLLSAGGFHPKFNQDEVKAFKVGTMKRVGLKLEYGDVIKISLEGYFAITPNSFQFGGAIVLKIGWDSFGLDGKFSFDALFYFKPFSFMFNVSLKLTVKAVGLTLMGIDAEFDLSGPAPWHAKGHAKFKILFIEIKVGFNETWGKNQTVSPRKYIELLPLFSQKVSDNRNWSIISGDAIDGLVYIIKPKGKDLVVQPSDRIAFLQQLLPLDTVMKCYGEDLPQDIQKIELLKVIIGDEEVKNDFIKKINSLFAPSLSQPLTEEEKLKKSSYENKQAGFELSDKGFGIKTAEKSAKHIPTYSDIYQTKIERKTTPVVTTTPEEIDKEKVKEMIGIMVSLLLNRQIAKAWGELSSKQVSPIEEKTSTADRITTARRYKKIMEEKTVSRHTTRRLAGGFKRQTTTLEKAMNETSINDLIELIKDKKILENKQ